MLPVEYNGMIMKVRCYALSITEGNIMEVEYMEVV